VYVPRGTWPWRELHESEGHDRKGKWNLKAAHGGGGLTEFSVPNHQLGIESCSLGSAAGISVSSSPPAREDPSNGKTTLVPSRRHRPGDVDAAPHAPRLGSALGDMQTRLVK
jgi:hypothetical protein